MTEISYIGKVGNDESAQRAGGIKPQPFIPYLSMTRGEMALALMQEQAGILAGFYGDQKYKEAETMLQNALYRGVHGSTPYLGAYNPELTGVAKAINTARRDTKPASNALFSREEGIGKGLHIGDPVIPTEDRLKACRAAADKLPGVERMIAQSKCVHAFQIEKIINDGLENCGQYLAYGYLPKGNNLPQTANLKIYNQGLAQADIARVGDFDLPLLQQWLNVGMMRCNVDVAKIAPYGWIDTNAILMNLPEAGQKEVIAILQKARPGVSASLVSAKIGAVIKKYKSPSVGDFGLIAGIIVSAILALWKPISQFVLDLQKQKLDAWSKVQGMGTIGFGPQEGDWDGDGILNEQDTTPNGESDNTLLYLGAGAAALYLLTK